MEITKTYYTDEDYTICRCKEKGLIIRYQFPNERPSPWLELHMKIMAWHILDRKAEFGEPNRIEDYWYIPIYISTKIVRSPAYKFG